MKNIEIFFSEGVDMESKNGIMVLFLRVRCAVFGI